MFNNNNQIKRLPKPFQKGSKENNKLSEAFNIAGIIAGIVLGAGQIFKGLTEADQALVNQQKKPFFK